MSSAEDRQAKFIYDEIAVDWRSLTEHEKREIKDQWNSFNVDFLSKAKWMKIVYGKTKDSYRWEAVYYGKKIQKRKR